MRSAALLDYLGSRYETDVVRFDLPHHSRTFAARLARNVGRLIRGVPPLFDRYSGHPLNIPHASYEVAVVEHFWCASYAPLLRPLAKRLVLDLHNIESQLAWTQARSSRWPVSQAMQRFARAYEVLEKQWLAQFDTLLVSSEDDKRRVEHPNVVVYPNALPTYPLPQVAEDPVILFTGNLAYQPNIEAVRWFHREVWPQLKAETTWRVAGLNSDAVKTILTGEKIELIGAFDNALETIARAQVAIVPLQSGSGTRFKILEAWAAGRAVVSTSIGAEGLDAIAGEHLLIADDAHSFAQSVRTLLHDRNLRDQIGQAGREHYLARFTWQVAARTLQGVL